MFEIGTGSLLSKSELTDGKTPRISAKSEENGVLGYFGTECLSNARHFENFITVNFFGTDGGVFYHPYKASIEMKVHTLKIPNIELNIKTGNFIATALKQSLSGFGYGSQLSSSKLKNLNLKIKLPVKSKVIDFDFMNSFITALEAERMTKLQAYLSAANLNDYTLTAEEQQVLDDFEQDNVEFSDFSYESIFDNIAQGRRLKKDDQLSGNIPFVMAGTTNTGVVNYISNPIASFPKNSITIDIFGNVFYRAYSFGAGDDTGVYWNNQKTYSKETMLFCTTSMQKSVANKFDFGKKLRSSKSFNFQMKLPVTNKQPDYEIMDTLISAIQKLVIKDAVLYVTDKMQTQTPLNESTNSLELF